MSELVTQHTTSYQGVLQKTAGFTFAVTYVSFYRTCFQEFSVFQADFVSNGGTEVETEC